MKATILKRLITILLMGLLVLGTLFISGCSEGDMENVLEVASSVLAEQGSGASATKEETEAETEKTTGYDETFEETDEAETAIEKQFPEDGAYYTLEQVSAYIHIYGHLPDNYITKDEAYDLGWEPDEGNLWEVADGMCIGGDRFRNNEGLLPKKKGRKYYECDVNYEGGHRGPERVVYSDDGLVYYTPDHYETFTLLFGEE